MTTSILTTVSYLDHKGREIYFSLDQSNNNEYSFVKWVDHQDNILMKSDNKEAISIRFDIAVRFVEKQKQLSRMFK